LAGVLHQIPQRIESFRGNLDKLIAPPQAIIHGVKSEWWE